MAFLFSLPLWLLAVVLNGWRMGVALIGVWGRHEQVSGVVSREATALGPPSSRGSSRVLRCIRCIITLDRPFRGPMAIPADSYQLVYDQLMNN